jgi:RsiW-degrading membrane proteinase PrsW (M82 family)
MSALTISTLASFVAATVWLIIVYRMDRHEKEPVSLLARIFVAGFVLSFVAGVANTFHYKQYGETVALMLVGPVEEGVKFLAVWWIAFRHKAFNAPIDGVVYATAAALGFAFSENIDYNLLILRELHGPEAGGAMFVRGLMPLMHVLFASIWGYGLGYYRCRHAGKLHLVSWWLLAAILHSTYDLVVDKAALIMMVTFVVLGIFFLRRMRHLNRISPHNTSYLMTCPYCSKRIAENSLYCRYCGAYIFLPRDDTQIYCKSCHSPIDRQWIYCKHCGTKLHKG